MSFNPEEKVRIKHHLGYPQVKSARTFFLGYPISSPVTTQADGSIENVEPQAENMVRTMLDRLDGIESQMLEDNELLAGNKVDEIEVNGEEFDKLVQQYKHWQLSLGNILGIPPNPFDQRFMGAAGGLNISVQ